MPYEITITLPDGSRRTEPVAGALEIGREPIGAHGARPVTVADPAVSRRHLHLEPRGDGLGVTDLGSANGTSVDGAPLTGTVVVLDGAEVLIGDSVLVARLVPPVGTSTVRSTAPARAVTATQRMAPPVDVVHEGTGVTVRATTGSTGEDVAPSVRDLAVRARAALAGLGAEPTTATVTIRVTDPFPDPDDPTRVVTRGSVIDPDTATVWLVVTPESPPEDPHRSLALLFGAGLPAAAEVDHLVEGYGLHLGGAAEPAPEEVAALAGAIETLDPEVRGPMAASFVRYLIEREGEPAFLTLLSTRREGLAAAWRDGYGRTATALEAHWRSEASEEPSNAGVRDFVVLARRYLRPYRWRQAEVFGLMLLSLAFTVTYPFVTQSLFDSAIPSGEMAQVLRLLGILAAAFAVTLVAGLRQEYQSAWIANSVVRDLRAEMFARLQRVPDAWVAHHPQGDVLSRLMNHVNQVQAGLSTLIQGGVFQMVSFVVATVIMFRVNLVLSVIVLVGVPIVAIVYRKMGAGTRSRSMEAYSESSALLSMAAENYQAGPVIRLFRLAGTEQARFDRAAGRMFRSQQRLSLYGGLYSLSVQAITTILRLGVLGVGTWLIFEGELTVGGLVAFLGVMGEVIGPATALTTLGQSIQASVGALVRVEGILEAEQEPAGDDLPAVAPFRSEIRFDQVSLSYTSESRALDRIDVTIPAGSRVAFVGPSGSGKSSILKVLMRMYEPDEGRVLVDGVDIATRSLSSWRGQLGVVFQDSFLFDTTVRENVALGAAGGDGASDEQVLAAAAAAEVEAFAESLPRGLDTLVGEGGRNLSGGQRQRVAIARALVGDPPILLLDEATSALDPRTERQISATLRDVVTGKTVISITHRLTSVVDHDRIFLIDDGRLAEQGTHEELLAAGGIYARLWSEQTGAPGPEAPAIDLPTVLAKLPPFANLDDAALATVAARFVPSMLDVGDVLVEGGDRLAVLQRGRAEIVGEGDGAVVRAVGPGDVFGLDALLGTATGTVLRATEPSTVLTLDGDELAELRSTDASIAAGQNGRSTYAEAPAGRLVRATNTIGRATGTGTGTGGTAGFTVADVSAAVSAARAQRADERPRVDDGGTRR